MTNHKPPPRNVNARLKTAKGRKISSTLWLQRQLNDPYVQRAKAEGYRSRAAYKLIELNEKFHFLKAGIKVVDLGAAPGGWSQVAADIVNNGKKGLVVGVDLLPIEPLADVVLFEGDFTKPEVVDRLKKEASGKVDVVLSDMAPNTTGHTKTDHIRIIALCEEAYLFACEVLNEGGVFISKVFQGGTENQLLNEIKRNFQTVKHAKPKASRADSAELYLVAIGFKGNVDA
jgi:23S rRNA (uridine2552-2'-O)-methyltransferase